MFYLFLLYSLLILHLLLLSTACKFVYLYSSPKVLVVLVGKQYMWTLKGVSLLKDSEVNIFGLEVSCRRHFMGIMEISNSWPWAIGNCWDFHFFRPELHDKKLLRSY